MMFGKPLHVALVERDQRIGAAVAGALTAIVLRCAHAKWSPIVECTVD